MFPILIIAIGIAVLALGKRVAVLGAAVGAIVGVALLGLFNISTDNLLLAILIPGGLAALGFFAAGFAKGIIKIVLLVFGALAGAAIVLTFLNLFNVPTSLLSWVLALVGGVVGLMLIRRYDELGLIILSGIIGALLVTRGLTIWLPSLQGAVGTLIVLVLAGGSIGYQGGFFARRKAAAAVKTTTPATAQPNAPAQTATVTTTQPDAPVAPAASATLPPPTDSQPPPPSTL